MEYPMNVHKMILKTVKAVMGATKFSFVDFSVSDISDYQKNCCD